MPKAIKIVPNNIDTVVELSGWPDAIAEDVLAKPHYYVQDVQFPHGYVDHCIVTEATFDATFKTPEVMSYTEMNKVDYI